MWLLLFEGFVSELDSVADISGMEFLPCVVSSRELVL